MVVGVIVSVGDGICVGVAVSTGVAVGEEVGVEVTVTTGVAVGVGLTGFCDPDPQAAASQRTMTKARRMPTFFIIMRFCYAACYPCSFALHKNLIGRIVNSRNAYVNRFKAQYQGV